jgi:mannose-6-phosphate isomerase-like protein (cupin superfamily)
MPERLPVYRFSDIPKEKRLHQGRMTRFSIRTKNAQVVFAEIQPQPEGQQTYHREPHDHPHDMMLIVMDGAMMMEIDGLEYTIEAGSAVVIPEYVMHRGYALGTTPASLIEIFAPVRADYIHLVEYQKEDFGDTGEAWVKPDLNSWNAPSGQ